MNFDSFLPPRKTTARHIPKQDIIPIDVISDDIPVWVAYVKDVGLTGELRLKAGKARIINGNLTLL